MKLSQLQHLVALYEHGTFSKAAQTRFISQPTLSVSIRELEEELGTQLVVRGTRGVIFTADGEAVLQKAQQVLRDVNEIYRICERARLVGEFNLAAPPHYCETILLDVKISVEKVYPQASVNLEESDSRSILKNIKDGKIDMGIVLVCDMDRAAMEEDISSGKVRFVELFTEPMCVSVCADHPLLKKTCVEAAELLRYPYGSYKKALNDWVAREHRSGDHSCRIFSVNDIGLLRILLAREHAFAIVPKRSITSGNAMFSAQMRELPINDVSFSSQVGLLYAAKPKTPFAKTIFSAIQEKCEEYQRQNPIQRQCVADEGEKGS